MYAAYSAETADGSRVGLRFGDRLDGDLRIDADPRDLAARREALCPHPWTWLRQVHGSAVQRIAAPGAGAGAEADGAVTDVPGAVLAIHTADCVPVLLLAERDGAPVVGACHAGWKGLYDGVVEATVTALTSSGASAPRAWIGPAISAAAYEFSPADLTTMALRFGPDVVSATSDGRPALDTRVAAAQALAAVGVSDVCLEDACTATDRIDDAPRFHSWRARRDVGRQASIIWIEGT